MIEVEDLVKTYQLGASTIRALDGINLQIREGEMVAIMGPSGSGKSTLLAILGCLDIPTSGRYRLAGEAVEQLSDDRLAEIRSRKIGFVFQQFNLLLNATALDNVLLPLLYNGSKGGQSRLEKARQALGIVGLEDRAHHYPGQLSGGEQQRVAIARALVNNPAVILADEPTGNLDSRHGLEILALFQRLNREHGITIVCVTHDGYLARHMPRIVHLKDGRVVRDERVESPLDARSSLDGVDS